MEISVRRGSYARGLLGINLEISNLRPLGKVDFGWGALMQTCWSCTKEIMAEEEAAAMTTTTKDARISVTEKMKWEY